MSDRRLEILNAEYSKWIKNKPFASVYPLQFPESYTEAALNAIDSYMKECILEFIEYVAKNNIQINNDNGEACCYLSNGDGITPGQLFENFL